MRMQMRSLVERLLREARGAEIAEAAAVLPLMFMMLLGIFWFGQAFSIYGTITRAAQEGARAGAATSQCATCGAGTPQATNAYNATEAALQAAKLDASNAQQVQLPLAACTTVAGSTSCDGISTNVCVQTGIQMSNTAGGGAEVCGVAVSFQYPFQFYLPFTSLNKQKIWMTASAQVRMETQ